VYNCIKTRVHCVKTITDAKGSGNVVNIKIHTSNESLDLTQEDIPIRDLNAQSPEIAPRRSNRLRLAKSCF